MRNLALIGMLLAQATVVLAWGNGVVYERPGTATEYPPAFKVKQDVTLKGTYVPELVPKLNKACRLKKGSEIIFVTAEQAVTQTYVTGKYQALTDLDWDIAEDTGPSTVKISKGQVVEDLSYIAEGFCFLRVDGKVYEGSCFGNGLEPALFDVQAELDQQTFALVSCGNGGKAWFNEAMLQESKALEAFLYNPY